MALFLGLASRAMAAAGEVPHQDDNTAMYFMMVVTGLAVIGIQQFINRCAAWTTRRRVEQIVPHTPTEVPSDRRSAPPTPMEVDQGRLDYDDYTPGAESSAGVWIEKPASLAKADISVKLDNITRWVEHYKKENRMLRESNTKLKNEVIQRSHNQGSLEASVYKTKRNEEKLKEIIQEKDDEIARLQVNSSQFDGSPGEGGQNQ